MRETGDPASDVREIPKNGHMYRRQSAAAVCHRGPNSNALVVSAQGEEFDSRRLEDSTDGHNRANPWVNRPLL
jgi:hypothetical protein